MTTPTRQMFVPCATCTGYTSVPQPDPESELTPVCRECRREMARHAIRYWSSFDWNLSETPFPHVPMQGYTVTAF